MSRKPTAEQVTDWLRGQGLDADTIVPGAVFGFHLGTGRYQLVYVASVRCDDEYTYAAHSSVVSPPPWLPHPESRDHPDTAADQPGSISAADRAVMAANLRNWRKSVV